MKRNSFDLFVSLYTTLLALALIVVGLIGPMLAVETGATWAAPFAVMTGLLGVWALMKQVDGIGESLRRASAGER